MIDEDTASIRESGRFLREVGVMAGQYGEFDGDLFFEPDPAQRVGKGAGRVGDDVGVAGVGLDPDRVWAIEGCNGIGKHIAHRLVHDGETVGDVPAKLSAQVRVFAAGNGRKTDPVDAHSVAMVALRTPNLVQVKVDAELVVLGMLADRRDELGRARTQPSAATQAA